MRRSAALMIFCVLGLSGSVFCDENRSSGLQPGQRPGPYAFVLSTGPQRGQSFCYICETADRPAVVVFSRSLSEPLAKLAQELDRAVAAHKQAELRSWITFLRQDQLHFDAELVQWTREHALREVPLGVFEDEAGPPSYRLARDADVTVLFFVKRKVVANFTFRAGEFTEAKVGEVMKALPKICP
jgi:hypothetical protein